VVNSRVEDIFMNISQVLYTADVPEWVKTVLSSVVLPVAVSYLTYTLIDRRGEWRKRRMHSKLGVAIIESLQEEIKNGIRLMTAALSAAEDNSANEPPHGLLPHKSWSGMSTIPDDVLLRIMETSAKRQFEGFPPHKCRTHCKNYFEHMCENYEKTLEEARRLALQRQDWRSQLRGLLADDTSHYIQSARKVDQMLEHAKKLLEDNAKARFPK
jgi:hypothetical protein